MHAGPPKADRLFAAAGAGLPKCEVMKVPTVALRFVA